MTLTELNKALDKMHKIYNFNNDFTTIHIASRPYATVNEVAIDTHVNDVYIHLSVDLDKASLK